jgi:hypothetical protein
MTDLMGELNESDLVSDAKWMEGPSEEELR